MGIFGWSEKRSEITRAADIEYRGECIEIQWPEPKWESDQLYSANGEPSSKHEWERPLKTSETARYTKILVGKQPVPGQRPYRIVQPTAQVLRCPSFYNDRQMRC